MASYKNYNLKAQTEGNLIKLPFIYPGQDDTGEYLMVRSRHCQAYREADMQAQRQMSSIIAAAGGVDKADQALMEEIQMRAFCKLVDSWSFEDDLTEENLLEFFETNPQMYDLVNTQCAKDTLFFAKPVKP